MSHVCVNSVSFALHRHSVHRFPKRQRCILPILWSDNLLPVVSTLALFENHRPLGSSVRHCLLLKADSQATRRPCRRTISRAKPKATLTSFHGPVSGHTACCSSSCCLILLFPSCPRLPYKRLAFLSSKICNKLVGSVVSICRNPWQTFCRKLPNIFLRLLRNSSTRNSC